MTALLAMMLFAGSARSAQPVEPEALMPRLELEAARVYPYQAITRQRAGRQGKVEAGALRWTCEGRECTAVGPDPEPRPDACKALAERVGALRSCAPAGGAGASGDRQSSQPTADAAKPPPAPRSLRPEAGAGVLGAGRSPQVPASSDLDVVSNPAPVRGGRGAEDVDEAEERAPRRLRHRDRVVTAEDFKARALDTPGVTRPQPPQPASRPGGGFAPAPSLGSGIRDSDVTTLHGDTLASLEEAPGLERSTLRRSRSALDRAAQSARAAIRLLEQPDAAAAALRRATDRLRLDERRLAALMPAIRAAAERAPRVSRERLGSTIKGAERQAEEARNRRDRVKSAFQHTDQQKNQLYQALSRVLRTMNDMRRLGAASRSGL